MEIPDRWLVQAAVAKKWLTIEQAKEACQIQAKYRQQNKELALAAILVRANYLQIEQLQQLQQQFLKANGASPTKNLPETQPTQSFPESRSTKKLPEKRQHVTSATNVEIVASDGDELAQSFGRFRIIKRLGQGNFGQVFLVDDPEWNRQLALKVLTAGQMADNVVIKRFQREGQAISQLRHDNIVGVYEIGKEQGRDYFTMDYIDGHSLSGLLAKEKRLSTRKAARIMAKVARAVHYAHEKNVVHRDIKPGNIMVDQNGEPHLTDFGLARAIRGGSRLSRTGNVIGTPAYMPPEQASGKHRDIDERSDVYSIGATLYHLITGQTPFPGHNPMNVLYKVACEPPIPPRTVQRDISPDLENICLKCLEKDKQDRYASAEELAQDLERFVEGGQVEAQRPAISWKRLGKATRTKIMIASACVVLVVLPVLFSYIAAAREEDARKRELALEEERNKKALEFAEQQRKLAEQRALELAEQQRQLAEQQRRLAEQQQKLAEEKAKTERQRELARKIAEQRDKEKEWWRERKKRGWGGDWSDGLKFAKKLGIDEEKIAQAMGVMRKTNALLLPDLPSIGSLPSQENLQAEFTEVFQTASQMPLIGESHIHTVRGQVNLLSYQLYRQKVESERYLAQAIEEFRKASISSNDYIATLAGYQISYLLPNPDKAQAVAEEFLHRLPTESDDAYMYLRKGCEAQRKQQNRQALDFFAKALAKTPALPIAHHERGIARRNQGEYDKARESLLQSCEIPSLSMPALIELIVLDLHQANVSKTKSSMYRAWAQQWYELATIHNPALVRAKQSRWKSSLQSTQVHNNPTLVEGEKEWDIMNYGWLLPNMVIAGYLPPEEGELEDVFEELAESSMSYPPSKTQMMWGQACLLLHQRYARISGTSGNYLAKATRRFSESKNLGAALLGYHSCHLLPQWDDELAEKFLQRLPTQGESAHAYFRKGCEARQKKQHQQSLDYFAKALVKNPALTAIYLEQSIAYRDLGEYRKARASLLKGCEIPPLSLPALLELISLNLRQAQSAPAKSSRYRLRARQWYEWASIQYPALLAAHREKWQKEFPKLVQKILPEIDLEER